MDKTINDRIEDAKRLKELIRGWKAQRAAKGLPSTLADLGALVGGITQSAVSQYANGSMALNPRALLMFSGAFGVSPAEISPSITAQMVSSFGPKGQLSGTSAVGMVYAWPEVVETLTSAGAEYLPDLFSAEIDRPMLGGLLRSGDIAILSKLHPPRTGDGIIVRHEGEICPAIYWPGPSSQFYAQLGDGSILDHARDNIHRLFSIVGMPTLTISRLIRWAA